MLDLALAAVLDVDVAVHVKADHVVDVKADIKIDGTDLKLPLKLPPVADAGSLIKVALG